MSSVKLVGSVVCKIPDVIVLKKREWVEGGGNKGGWGFWVERGAALRFGRGCLHVCLELGSN